MVALANNLARLRRAAGAAWRPVELPATPDWCETNVRLSPDYEASAGNYDLTRRPYWRGVLACFDDPEVATISVRKSTQVGGTMTLIAAMLSRCVISPAPAMIVTPDRESSIELRDRSYADALESPALRDHVPAKRHWNTRALDLKTMRAYLAYSGARQRLRGRPCKYVFLTEVDVYGGDKKGGDPVKASHERVKAFYRWKIYKESSPSADPSTIDQAYVASDQQTWQCPCPHCGTHQELRFFPYKNGEHAEKGGIAGLKDKDGNFLEPEEARKRAHYVCVSGCRIDNEHKQAMVEAGVWVPKGCRVERDGQGMPQVVGQRTRAKRHAGFHLWSVHADTCSFGDIAGSYLEHRRDGKLAEFYGNWLGLAFSNRAKLPTWEQLGRRLAWSHVRATVPPEVWFLSAGGDVQDDEIYWSIRGFGDRCSSWLIDWGLLHRRGGDDADGVKSDLAQIQAAVLDRTFPITSGRNPLGKSSLSVRLFGIDANHRTMDVHEWIRSLGPNDRVRAVRGDHKVDPVAKYRRNVVDRNARTGEVYEGGLELWGLYVYHFYQDLIQRLVTAPVPGQVAPGGWYVTADALQSGRDYLRQVTNFQKTVDVDDRGVRKAKWGPRSKMIGNDWWDTEVYTRATAEMIVDSQPEVLVAGKWLPPGWDASKWPRPNPDGAQAARDKRLKGRAGAPPTEFSAR